MQAAVKRFSHSGYDAWQGFSERRVAVILVFVWALAEATVWPFAADFLLAALLLVRRPRFWVLAAACIAGMATGGVVTVLVAHAWPGFALELLRDLPLMTGALIDGAADMIADHGVAGFLIQPWGGIPFKAWAVQSGQLGLSPWLVIPAFIAARATRMLMTAVIAHLLGRALRRGLRDWFALIAPLYLAGCAAVLVALS